MFSREMSSFREFTCRYGLEGHLEPFVDRTVSPYTTRQTGRGGSRERSELRRPVKGRRGPQRKGFFRRTRDGRVSSLT